MCNITRRCARNLASINGVGNCDNALTLAGSRFSSKAMNAIRGAVPSPAMRSTDGAYLMLLVSQLYAVFCITVRCLCAVVGARLR